MLVKLFIFTQLSNIELGKHDKTGQIILSFGILAQLQFYINLSTNPKNTFFMWHFNRISCFIGMNFQITKICPFKGNKESPHYCILLARHGVRCIINLDLFSPSITVRHKY